MNHGQAADWILDMHTGRLDPVLGDEVSAHVRDCERCRAVLSVHDVVTAAMSLADANGSSRVDHVDAVALVAYVMEPETFDAARRDAIDEHVGHCGPCARELAAVRSAEADHRTGSVPDRPRRRRTPVSALGTWGRLAAGLAVAFLGLSGLAWLWKLPEAQREIAGLRERLSESESLVARITATVSGPQAVALPLFRGALRAGKAETEIAIAGGNGRLPLAVAPGLPRDTADEARHVFSITDAGGRTVHSVELSAGEIRRLTGDSDVFGLMVPEPLLSPGPHVLTVTDHERGIILLEQPFSVVRRGEEPQEKQP